MGVRSEKQTGASGGSRSHSQGPGFSSFLAPLGIVNLADGCLVYISKKKKKLLFTIWERAGVEKGRPFSSGER